MWGFLHPVSTPASDYQTRKLVSGLGEKQLKGWVFMSSVETPESNHLMMIMILKGEVLNYCPNVVLHKLKVLKPQNAVFMDMQT